MYGKCKKYGKRFHFNLKLKKGFIPLNMSRGLGLDLHKKGLCN
jgi:hypothetical protein